LAGVLGCAGPAGAGAGAADADGVGDGLIAGKRPEAFPALRTERLGLRVGNWIGGRAAGLTVGDGCESAATLSVSVTTRG